MLNDGPLRLITQGQEISSDVDEKTLIDFGFKDLQVPTLEHFRRL
jgi:ubiquitin carboxyl-terminal hydrolase 34